MPNGQEQGPVLLKTFEGETEETQRLNLKILKTWPNLSATHHVRAYLYVRHSHVYTKEVYRSYMIG